MRAPNLIVAFNDEMIAELEGYSLESIFLAIHYLGLFDCIRTEPHPHPSIVMVQGHYVRVKFSENNAEVMMRFCCERTANAWNDEAQIQSFAKQLEAWNGNEGFQID